MIHVRTPHRCDPALFARHLRKHLQMSAPPVVECSMIKLAGFKKKIIAKVQARMDEDVGSIDSIKRIGLVNNWETDLSVNCNRVLF